MDFFFKPQGIAVIGATPNPFKGGNAILKNLLAGFRGGIYPINPRYGEIEGLPCYPTVDEVPGLVDLAIVFVPGPQVPEAVAACADRRIPGVIIESGGFAETGDDGGSRQAALAAMARETGIRIWGPNCMGLVDAVNGHVFSFLDPRAFPSLIPGRVSLVVQSGMLSAGFLVDIMTNGVMGISKVCSVGNKIDVNECDLLPWLMEDPDTAVIGLYLESIPEGRRLIDLCRKSAKPIVVLKGGKSEKGAQAAMSHTASLAGNQRIIADVLAQTGVIEACDFKQMMDLCRSLAIYPEKPSGAENRIAILTFSGGAGIVSSDFVEQMNLKAAVLSTETKTKLRRLFPDWMPVANPVDLWPAMEKHAGSDLNIYSEALRATLADPGVDAVLLHIFVGNFRIKVNLEDIAAQSRDAGKPVFIWMLGRREQAFQTQVAARQQAIPVFQELHRAVECLAAVMHRKRRAAPGTSLQDAHEPSLPPSVLRQLSECAAGPLDEYASKRILKTCGIRTVGEEIVGGQGACAKAAARIGFPVVLKGLQPGGIHKTELGLVRLDIKSKAEAVRAFKALKAKMNGRGQVLIQKQVEGSIELILGLMRDPQFGPCVMIGLGGVMAEVFDDAVFAMAPLSHDEGLNLMGRLRGQKLLNGFRGDPPVDRDEIARMLTALGNLGLAFLGIQEIDINPMLVGPAGAVAVDATIILS